MTALIILPHTDPTVRYQAPGYEVAALHTAAVRRLTGSTARRELIAALAADPDTVGELGLAIAADRVLSAAPDPAATLIATAVVLELRSRLADWSVRLRLDDLELAAGSTESSTDAAGAVPGLPFGPELATGRALRDQGGVCWVQGDQQLPALFALADRPLVLDGPFARTHWAALRRVLPAGSTLADTHAAAVVDGHRLAWLTRDAGLPWADLLTAAEVLERPDGCAVAIIPVTGAGPDGVRTADGAGTPEPEFAAAVRALARAGTPVLAEFWFGAPGSSEHDLTGTAGWLAAADLPWRVAGVRPFHLRPWWQGPPVPLRAPAAHLDLARAPRLDHPAADHLVPGLAARLAGRYPPIAGRLAGAYLAATRAGPATPELAPGVATVAAGDGYLLVDLATRRTFTLAPRLGTRLAALPAGAPLTAVLPPGRVLDRAVALLSSIGVLTGAAAPEAGS